MERIKNMSKDGFASIADAISIVETSFPHARYITPFSAAEYLIGRWGKCEVFIINGGGQYPRTAKLQLRADTPLADDGEITFPAIGKLPSYAIKTLKLNRFYMN